MVNYRDEEEESLSCEERYYRLSKKFNSCEIELKKAERELQICLSSASYRLGHLLIHELRSVKDLKKFFSRIKAIKHSKNNANPLPKSNLYTKNVHSYEEVDAGKFELCKGISVLVPTYKGEKTIYRALLSLAQQDLSRDLFEVIIVINGEEGGTGQVIKSFSQDYPDLKLRVFKSSETGASLARNMAIKNASHQYTVLLDDDDTLSATYLSSMFELASEDAVVLSQIINIDEGIVDSSNANNMQILNADRFIDNVFKACPGVLTINACKLIPTRNMKLLEYDTTLRNGEDIVFFSELFCRFSFRFRIAKEALYFRYLEKNSISRQPVSFDFNVIDRLRVIEGVYRVSSNAVDNDVRYFLEQKIAAQISFINTYLQMSPNDYSRVLGEIKKYELDTFPVDQLYQQSQ